jgi:hypothetical protein
MLIVSLFYLLFVLYLFVSLLYRFTIDEVQGVQNTKGYEIQMVHSEQKKIKFVQRVTKVTLVTKHKRQWRQK